MFAGNPEYSIVAGTGAVPGAATGKNHPLDNEPPQEPQTVARGTAVCSIETNFRASARASGARPFR